MKNITRIAIDGPGGAGKSTVAKQVAKRLNIDYVDTGAMYRAVALKISEEISRENLPENQDGILDIRDLNRILENTEIDFSGGSIFLDGKVVDKEIRSPKVAMLASKYSSVKEVRQKLVELQKDMARGKSLVMDGRDIGTNVIPDAELKLFITASLEIRARRRMLELEAKGKASDYETIYRDIELRDKQDRERKLNPLVKADDALLIDTSSMTVEEVVDFICKKMI